MSGVEVFHKRGGAHKILQPSTFWLADSAYKDGCQQMQKDILHQERPWKPHFHLEPLSLDFLEYVMRGRNQVVQTLWPAQKVLDV